MAYQWSVLFHNKITFMVVQAYEIWMHTLGQIQAQDQLVFNQSDIRLSVEVGKSNSGEFILINSYCQVTSEVSVLSDCATSVTCVTPIIPQQPNVVYSVDHGGDSFFYILTNADGAYNFKVQKIPTTNFSIATPIDVISHDPSTLFLSLIAYRDHLVLTAVRDETQLILIFDLRSDSLKTVDIFDDYSSLYSMFASKSQESQPFRSVAANITTFEFSIESFLVPSIYYSYDLYTEVLIEGRP